MKTLTRIFATAGLVAALAMPALAITHQGIAPGQQASYTTTLTQEWGPGAGVGAYEGTLQLTLDRNGLINGYYRPDGGSFEAVTGGVQGNNVWLDIGMLDRIHITGKFDGTQIVGYSWIHGREFVFGASPKRI